MSAQPSLRIIPLGGLHEIGKNTCVYEYEDEIILLDAGLAFPTDGMHGVNVVLPDMTYLRENQHRIKGMIVTHGHEDHIGGIPFHLQQIQIPIIYGPRLAMALLSGKMEEAGVAGRTQLETVVPREIVRLGKHFTIQFIRNTHSIADSFTVAIRTPLGVVIHTGDFKFDHTPIDGEYFDIQKLAEYGEEGVLCLVSDSTNAELPGFTPSERSVFPNLDRAFSQADARLIVTTFASSVHRVNMILELAKKQGRKVTVLGRSMLNVIAHARTLGYIHCEDDLFVPLREANNLPDRQLLILTTGSQGEPLAALTRIARGEHPQVKIRKGDTVVFSANPIPGNTIAVVNTIDQLMMQGANVIYGKGAGIHVSGHGCQEDHKLMLALTKPKFFLPVHGEHRMLVQHGKTAQSMGIPAENMIVIDNGDVVELTPSSISTVERVAAGIELVDTSRSGMVDGQALKERQKLAEDGMVTMVANVSPSGQLTAPPVVQLRGVVTSAQPERVHQWATREIEMVLESRWGEFCRRFGDGEVEIDWIGLQAEIALGMERRLKRELKCVPMIVCILQTAGTARPVSHAVIKASGTNGNGNGSTPAPVEEERADTQPRLRRRRSSAAGLPVTSPS